MTEKDKTYEALLLLGVETDTQDTSGTVLKQGDTSALVVNEVEQAILSFVGEYDQIPPMYSALKVNGKKLYELAREGKTVERKARRVQIHNIRILEIDLPRVRMEVECSKGTYIRTLCHDIGEKLGCGGCMENLIRTKVSCFELKDSYKLEEIAKIKAEGNLEKVLMPVDALFPQYPQIVVKKKWEKLAYNGNGLPVRAVFYGGQDKSQKPLDGEFVRLYDEEGQFLAIYQYTASKNEYSIIKMFYTS